jgi:hypothetical protein
VQGAAVSGEGVAAGRQAVVEVDPDAVAEPGEDVGGFDYW